MPFTDYNEYNKKYLIIIYAHYSICRDAGALVGQEGKQESKGTLAPHTPSIAKGRRGPLSDVPEYMQDRY